MSSAKSRLELVTSLSSARRGVGRCVEAIPVSANALKLGAVALGGTALVGILLSSRRKAKAVAALPPPASSRGHAHPVLSEAVLTLLLPLLRRCLLSDSSPLAAWLSPTRHEQR